MASTGDLHLQGPTGERSVVQEGAGVGWSIDDFSSDETRVLVSHYLSVNESRLYEIDLASGERTRLLADTKAAFGTIRYGASDDVYFTTDMDAEFMRLHRLDTETGELAVLTPETPWDIESFALSRDRERLAYVVNEDGISRLVAFDLTTGAFIALPQVPPGVISGLRFHPDNRRLGFTVRSPTAPSGRVQHRLRDPSAHPLDEERARRLEGVGLAEPQLIRYPTFDGRSIPAFVYRPPGPGPHPVLISIHGGPEGQSRPTFSSTAQYYVAELGAAVIYPNVRGSRGYGKTWLKLDNGRLREDSVRDIGALLDWIATQGDLDSDRIAVSGGSYGGYMVLACLVHYGDRLEAGVERVGISNFVTFLENTQPYRQDLRRVEYGDERDPRDARVPRVHRAAEPRRRNDHAAVDLPRSQRSPRTGERVGADSRRAEETTRPGLVRARQGRGSRLPQEVQPGLPERGHGDVP